MRIFRSLVCATITLSVSLGHAGVYEYLSAGAYTLSQQKVCESYDEKKALDSVRESSKCLGLEPQNGLMSLMDLSQFMRREFVKNPETAEDEFFGLLARQQVKELKCASEFAKGLTTLDSDSREDVEKKIELLRTFKGKLAAATTQLSQDPTITEKTCPLSFDDLTADQAYQSPKFTKLCSEIIRTRTAVNAVWNSIPLAHVPAVRSAVDSLSSPTKTSDSSKSQASSLELRHAYREAESELTEASQRLDLSMRISGAKGLDRTTRRTLLSDPLQVEKIKSATGPGKMDELLCSIDSHYGKGAEALDTGLFIGGLVLTTGAGMALKATGAAYKIFQGARAARSAGLLSVNGMRILQVSAAAVDIAAAGSSIDKACAAYALPDYKVSGTGPKQCGLSAPSIERIEHENCILTQTLSLLGFAGLEPVLQIRTNALAAVNRALESAAKKTEDFVLTSPKGERLFGKMRESLKEADANLLKRISGPGVDANTLRQAAAPIWNDDKLSLRQQVEETFEKYVALRKQNLNEPQKAVVDSTLKGTSVKGTNNAGYNPYTAETKIGTAFLDEEVSQFEVLAHELEHSTQFGAKLSGRLVKDKELKKRWKALMEKTQDAFAKPSRLHAEFEAMGAQWDYLQAIPPDIRRTAIEKLKMNTNLDQHLREMLIADVETSFKPRDEYIHIVAPFHGYTHGKMAFTTLAPMGFVGLMGLGMIGYSATADLSN